MTYQPDPQQPQTPQPGTPAAPQYAAPAAPQYSAGQPQQPATPAYSAQPYAAAPPTNTLAIISLVSAFFVSLAAVITGHIALKQIAARGEGGKGLAIAGLVLGYLGIAGTLLIIVLFFIGAVAGASNYSY